VLRRSTARATSAPAKVPATIIKGVAYDAECVLRACAPAPRVGDDLVNGNFPHWRDRDGDGPDPPDGALWGPPPI